MSNPLVKSGRLAWPAVIAVAFVVAAIVVFDLVWRIVTMSFESLAMGFIVALIVGAILIFVVARLTRAARQ